MERFARFTGAESEEIERDGIRCDASVAERLVGLRDFGLGTLFDNFIGRKRDVGGGVLAGLCCLGRFRESGASFRRWGPRDLRRSRFKIHRVWARAGWNVERRTGFVMRAERMCLELVKNAGISERGSLK